MSLRPKRSSRKLRNWDATHGRNFSEIIFSIFIVILHLPFPGQITQWNLIFYGTNDPPQQSDPDRLGKKKTVNDLVHNSLENSQWGFITQDVSISFIRFIEHEVNGARNQKTISFLLIFSSRTGDWRRRSLGCSANRWRRPRPRDEFRMSQIFRLR